jgi:hypothetical protein
MSARPAADPLASATRLLIDGTNLLYALARAGGPLPPVAVTGRLRALVPSGVSIILVLDGSPAPGGVDRRLTSGIEVRYAGRRSADLLLADLAVVAPEGTLVVTDDIALATNMRASGARTARTAWLAGRLARQRLESPSAGRPKPPPGASQPSTGRRSATGHAITPGDPDGDVQRWKPGRGATKKTGNPRRGHRPG